MSEHQSLLVQTLKYGEERQTQSLRCEGFENYGERRIITPKHTKTHQQKVVWYEWLGNGGERRRPSKFRRKKTIDREEEVGCMCIEVICNCVEVEVVHKWIDRVYWKCIDWLCLLAPPSISRLICQGGVAGATFAFSVHSQIFHPRLQVDNGRRGNRLTACGHATSRAKCSLEVASFNLWTRISCHTEGMSRWWK